MFFSAAPPLADDTLHVVVVVIVSVFLVILMIMLATFYRDFHLWFQAYMSRGRLVSSSFWACASAK